MKNFLLILLAIVACYLMGTGVVQIVNLRYQIGTFNIAMNVFNLAIIIKSFKTWG